VTALVWLLGGGLIAATAGVLALSAVAILATRRAGEQQARSDVLDERLTAASVVNSDLVNRLKDETGRADALDVLLADYAVSGPVLGSYERLLQKWRLARPSAVDSRSQVAVSVAGDTGPTPQASTDLLRPGE
jgi:hypothetical protein